MPGPWSRDDAVLAMAIYMDRPGHMMVPPMAERERVASILRRDLGEVTDHMWCFHRLSAGEAVDCVDGRVWTRYRPDPAGLWEAADAVMGRARRAPRFLRRGPSDRSG